MHCRLTHLHSVLKQLILDTLSLYEKVKKKQEVLDSLNTLWCIYKEMEEVEEEMDPKGLTELLGLIFHIHVNVMYMLDRK